MGKNGVRTDPFFQLKAGIQSSGIPIRITCQFFRRPQIAEIL
ncbi:hypothetical protein HOLDEFILI_04155 [Holdemania filiformis DSM 12042]|uniref:Uncharacterized protein n=1 Tax=Holdemania filiformis DSM 12042 TaxID=545696 RepID=B9YE81_9FIRM|nr:hypothetical protein HOLDEFILI_04155 [Holdemania filiformis DSM 12042]